MRIVLTGGGTGGHIFPNIAVFEMLKSSGVVTRDILYVGERGGMEEEVCQRYGVPFSGISAGKFRRYFSLENFRDALKFPAGFFEARRLLRDFKPDVIFSKGGYVGFPVVLAGRLLGARIVIHDSDAIPGLATRLSAPFADTICVAWKEALRFFPVKKTVLTGIPLRQAIFSADADEGFRITGFRKDKPVIFVSGGSLGAKRLNELVIEALPMLLPHCQVVHFTGKGKIETVAKHAQHGHPEHTEHTVILSLPTEQAGAPVTKATGSEGSGSVISPQAIIQARSFAPPLRGFAQDDNRYKAFESLDQEYAHVLASSDLCISRAGANALFEYMALGKPIVLLPLGCHASRGDQIANAEILEQAGVCKVFDENALDGKALAERVLELIKDQGQLKKMEQRAKCFWGSVEKSGLWKEVFNLAFFSHLNPSEDP